MGNDTTKHRKKVLAVPCSCSAFFKLHQKGTQDWMYIPRTSSRGESSRAMSSSSWARSIDPDKSRARKQVIVAEQVASGAVDWEAKGAKVDSSGEQAYSRQSSNHLCNAGRCADACKRMPDATVPSRCCTVHYNPIPMLSDSNSFSLTTSHLSHRIAFLCYMALSVGVCYT